MLGQFTRENEANSGLDLAGGDGGTLVVGGQLGGFGGDALKDVVDEGVQDGHGLVGDTSVGVDLLQHTVNVGGVGFLASNTLLLVARGSLDLLLSGLRGS